MQADPVLIRTTHDGRRIEVIGARICLDGQPEADELVVIDEHPNRQAILKVVPLAEASVAQAALRRATDRFDGSAQAARERLRQVVWRKSVTDGVE